MPRASQVVPLNLEAQAGDNTRPPPPPPPLEATPLAWEPSESSLDFLTGSEALGGRSLPAGASEFSPRVASLRYSISDVAGAKLRAKKKKQNTRKKSSKTPLSPGASKERPSSRVGPLMKGETELGIALALHDVAEHGDVERLLDLMDNGWRHESRGVDASDPSLGGQTALHRAIKCDHPEVAELLLEEGADPLAVDASHRTPWYYAFFASNLSDKRRALFVDLLCAFVGAGSAGEELPPELFVTAIFSQTTGLKRAFMDTALPFEVTSRDTNENCKGTFANLATLDTPAAAKWPDGSESRSLPVLIHAVDRREIEAVTHPSMMALVNWKWWKWCFFVFLAEFVTYIALVSVFSASVVLHGQINMMDGGGRRADHATDAHPGEGGAEPEPSPCEGAEGCDGMMETLAREETVAFTLACMLTAVELWMAWCGWRRRGVIGRHLTPLMCYGGVILTCSLQWSGYPEALVVCAAAYACVLLWVRLRFYMQLSRKIGPFFIMVEEMMIRDIGRFLVLLAVIIPGFALGLTTIFAVDCSAVDLEEEIVMEGSAKAPNGNPMEWVTFGRGLHSLILLMFGLQSFPRALCVEHFLTELLLVLFLLLVPLLLLNLLIAMLSETYARIQSVAVHRWAFGWAEYVVSREALLPRAVTAFTGAPMALPMGMGRVAAGGLCEIQGKYNQIFFPRVVTEDLNELLDSGRSLSEAQDEMASHISAAREAMAGMSSRMEAMEAMMARQDLLISRLCDHSLPGAVGEVEEELAGERRRDVETRLRNKLKHRTHSGRLSDGLPLTARRGSKA